MTSRKVGDGVGIPWVQATCGRCEWCLRGKPMFCQQQIGTSNITFKEVTLSTRWHTLSLRCSCQKAFHMNKRSRLLFRLHRLGQYEMG